jgi:hypothetical protein
MSFWDSYKDTGGNYISAEEKQVLIDEGVPLTVVSIIEDERNKYGPRYVAKVLAPNPETGDTEERNIGFPIGTVESRDRMLDQMASYLEEDGQEPVVVKLEKVGRSIIIRKAE